MRLLILPLLIVSLAAQTPSFEVASVRPTDERLSTLPLCLSFKLSAESVLASVISPFNGLVTHAFQTEVDDFDLPEWGSSRFSVSVKIPPNTSADTCRQMLRSLLAERFRLVTAVVTREVPRYFLTVAKSGLKMKPVDNPQTDPNSSVSMSVETDRQRYTFRSAPMSRVFTTIAAAAGLDARARRVEIANILNETGLTGYYDGELQYTLSTPVRLAQFPQPESLEDALARQLGLTLELRKAPGNVLVVLSSDRMPTEN